MEEKLLNALNHSAHRYVIVGILAFSSDYSLLILQYYLFHISLGLATTTSYIIGLIISFSLNRRWTFGSRGRHKHIILQGLEYGTLAIINYLFTFFSIKFLHDHNIQPYISKIVTMACITIWNYFIYRYVIFTSTYNYFTKIVG